jgi:hypothetical protein
MDVISHQHPGIAAGFGLFNNSTKALYKIVLIVIFFEDRFSLYSTNDDMMQSTCGMRLR